MSGLEYGARYVVNADGVPIKQTKRSNRGFVIQGEATRYNEILYHDTFGPGRFIEIQPDAFAISMKYEPPVQLWLDHDFKLAMPGCRVELYSDERALSFRAHLTSRS
jgi:phage head maturation protease